MTGAGKRKRTKRKKQGASHRSLMAQIEQRRPKSVSEHPAVKKIARNVLHFAIDKVIR